jgi:hypothetical protein
MAVALGVDYGDEADRTAEASRDKIKFGQLPARGPRPELRSRAGFQRCSRRASRADAHSLSAPGLIPGLISIAVAALTAGIAVASFGGFGIAASLLIGWASSFVGLLAVVACVMLCDTLRGCARRISTGSVDTNVEMATLRARWGENVAMAHMSQMGLSRGFNG